MSLNPEAGLEVEPTAEIAWPDPEFELTLRKPVEFKGEIYERFLLREPTGAEWEQIFAHPAASRRRFANSLIAGVPMGVCAQVGIGDLVRGEAYLNSFFECAQVIDGR